MSDTDFALKQVRDQIKAALDERDAAQARCSAVETEVEALISRSVSERRDISDEETSRLVELRADGKTLADERDGVLKSIDGLKQREKLLVEHEAARAASKASAEKWAGAAPSVESVGAPARVTREARTYGRASAMHGVSFFKDIYANTIYRDPSSAARLERHSQEARVEELAGYQNDREARAVGTGAFAGLTVPQYLTDLVAPLQRAMAPTVGVCNKHPLPPDGMTVNISRITTGSAVAAQATENSAVQNTDADDTLLTVNVRTYAGQQDISRQALERGTGTDEIIVQDLTNDYWSKVDAAILNSDGTSGTHLGIRSTSSIITVTYTDASPTAAEAYKELAELVSGIQSGVYMGVSHFVMSPRRWWWLSAGISSSFPMMHVPNVDTVQAGNIGGTEYMAQNRNILGIPVIVDGNMLTNIGAGTEDVILGVTNRELHFWEDGVQFVRAEQTTAGSLTVKFVIYGYSAFTAGRYPGAHGLITGTGLIAPVFTTA